MQLTFVIKAMHDEVSNNLICSCGIEEQWGDIPCVLFARLLKYLSEWEVFRTIFVVICT